MLTKVTKSQNGRQLDVIDIIDKIDIFELIDQIDNNN